MKSSVKTSVFPLAVAGAIAGIYAVLCLVFAPVSYGAVQVRVAEILTVLPVYFPAAVPGLTVGCLIANLIGGTGVWDLVIGSGATLIAAIVTRLLRRVRWHGLPLLSTLPPVIFNAVAVGAEWAAAGGNGFSWQLFAAAAASVACGQFLACTAGGLLLARLLEKYHLVTEGTMPFNKGGSL